jgi:hypothetical protein
MLPNPNRLGDPHREVVMKEKQRVREMQALATHKAVLNKE